MPLVRGRGAEAGGHQVPLAPGGPRALPQRVGLGQERSRWPWWLGHGPVLARARKPPRESRGEPVPVAPADRRDRWLRSRRPGRARQARGVCPGQRRRVRPRGAYAQRTSGSQRLCERNPSVAGADEVATCPPWVRTRASHSRTSRHVRPGGAPPQRRRTREPRGTAPRRPARTNRRRPRCSHRSA
jgi:hypothetical protein